jgi:hypothetical protein
VCCSIVFIVGIALVGGCSAAMLRIRGAAPFLMAGGVCAAAALIAGSTVLSLLSSWTRVTMLALLLLSAAAAVVGWSATGHPLPPRLPNPRGLRRLRGHTAAIVGLAAVALLVQAYVGARVAPNNWDSMRYHLSRSAYWLQYHSIAQFPGASIHQAASAPNGEVLQALTMMMSGTDRWAASVQWLALVGIALAVFSGARLLCFGREPSAFAACLFVLLPQPLMQSTTTQNDLIEAFFIASTAYFVVRGLRDRSRGDMIVAALALALAVGTKGTAFVAGTALVVLAVAALIAYRPPARFIAVAVAQAVLALIALGCYNYLLNIQHRGGLLGGIEGQTLATGARLQNALLALTTFADSPGVSVDWLDRLVGSAPGHLTAVLEPPVWHFFTVDTSVQEDTSAFGLVGFLLLPCIFVLMLVSRRQTRGRRVLSAAVILSFVVFAATVAFNPWLGRVLIPLVALAAPLFAVLAERPAVAGVTLMLAILSLVPSLLQNSQKPLLASSGASSVFALDRRMQMTLTRPEMLGVLNALDAQVGRTEAIAYVGGEDSWDYPFFGAHRERRVIRHDNPAVITYPLLRGEHVAGAVFANVGTPPSSLAAIPLGPDYWWVPVAR